MAQDWHGLLVTSAEPLSLHAVKPEMDAHLGIKLYLVKALHAVPDDSLQVKWLKENHNIHDMLRQTILQLPQESLPDVCALWAKLCWLDWIACSPSDKEPDPVALSEAAGPLWWTTALADGTFASMFESGCMQVGLTQACWQNRKSACDNNACSL